MALALIRKKHLALIGSLALTGLSSWLWLLLIGSGPCYQGAGILLSQFTVPPSRLSSIVFHSVHSCAGITLTCLSRYNVSCFWGLGGISPSCSSRRAFQRCLLVFCCWHLSVRAALVLALCGPGLAPLLWRPLAGWATNTFCSVAGLCRRLCSGGKKLGSGFGSWWSAVLLTVIPGVLIPSQQQMEKTYDC
ncbi:uncharacterized protein YALI1_F18696g [Yarrowia lipolytica]|uniref:Uncharacterized protein n=1 Tax=Yarrowia lipolytica TaxID=4952 RepID=A0A1D8NND9_YARLL|nr:hypothetical protein YALI1_F18696g [Yarrowia lipolytica]